MGEGIDFTNMLAVVGAVIVAGICVQFALKRSVIPALVGYLALGFGLRLLQESYGLVGPHTNQVLRFMGQMGLFALLFRVGLEANIKGLLEQLGRASLAWTSDVLVSGALGFLAGYYLFGLSLPISLALATALTATSVGISVAVWQDAGRLGTPTGELLLDVAELDDISAVVLMALLFALAPQIAGGEGEGLWGEVAATSGWFLIKFAGFAAFCLAFSTWAEGLITRLFRRREDPPSLMILVAGMAILIAVLADALGFSLAIGAFFAGLVFSRDPRLIKIEGSFEPVYDLFAPFFFVSIGLDLAPQALGEALWLGLGLAAVAVASKVLANGAVVWALKGPAAALLVGASMVPRAEIALVIAQRGVHGGGEMMSQHVYAGVILMAVITCVAGPLAVRWLLRRTDPQARDS